MTVDGRAIAYGNAIAMKLDNQEPGVREPGVRNPRLKAEVGLIRLSVKYNIINSINNHCLEYPM
ncbi:hypothetical protein [Anabaenopsis elenkinii]|uniref:Uncharacterized protein n=1 Tax=Anabaenopsis elenkinii CCIBt3563 TaxID=2779889 RepID=A0A7S6U6B9_9CYAN|nr:hypothetical protein [Anabaenopsis elenkinii]QOV22738.1 hypothetical protein IM676_19205 [Anabaenopsis elenkinii CCIBt3563]